MELVNRRLKFSSLPKEVRSQIEKSLAFRLEGEVEKPVESTFFEDDDEIG